MDNPEPPTASGRRMIQVTFLAWVAMLGVDVLLHVGVLAVLYTTPGPFLLEPDQALARIPLSYAAFLLQAMLLTWLWLRLDIARTAAGFGFGLALGGVIWGSLMLALASISTAPSGLLVGWFIGQTLEVGVAGGVLGAGLKAQRLRRLSLFVILFVAACLLLTFVLQNVGLVPGPHFTQ